MKYVYIILICSILSALWVDTPNNVSDRNISITYDSVSSLTANLQLVDITSSKVSEASTISKELNSNIKEKEVKVKEKPTRLTKSTINTSKTVSKNTSSINTTKVSSNIINVLNKNLRQYIIDHEGLMLQPYECLGSKGKKKHKFYTIGYGHVIKSSENYLYKGITKSKAESILTDDLLISYNELSKLEGVNKLTLNQKLACSHFIFALGIGSFTKSTIYKHIRKGEINKIKEHHFTVWCRINGKKNKNHIKMRKFEYNLWLK